MTICAPSRQVHLLRTVYCIFLLCVFVCAAVILFAVMFVCIFLEHHTVVVMFA